LSTLFLPSDVAMLVRSWES